MSISKIDIEQIRPEFTWKLRLCVLYPDASSLSAQAMPEDEHGTHFGAFYNNQLVGVLSVFHEYTDFQFRKFAVDAAMQGKGIGTRLLYYVTGYAVNEGATRLWCNARVTATGFYEKAGFTETGNQFSRNGFEYVIMEKHLQQ